MHFSSILLFSLPSVLSVAIPQEVGDGDKIIPDCTGSFKVVEAENPDPHQHYLLRQVTETTTCNPGQTCSQGKEHVIAHTKSFSVAGGNEFFALGFEISETTSAGETATCYGGVGDTVCIFYRQAYTSFTANRVKKNSCFDDEVTPFVITAPNSNSVGSSFVCGTNSQCHSPGHEYWNNMERQNGGGPVVGGPQEWKFKGPDGKVTYAGIIPDFDEIEIPEEGDPDDGAAPCTDFVGSCTVSRKGVSHQP